MSEFKSVTVAAVQMISTPDLAENMARAEALIAEAAARGAELVALPEYWPIMGAQDTDKLALAEALGAGPIQSALRAAAARHGLWLVGGTIPLVSSVPGKVLNTSLIFGPDGQPAARYDKIHLFGFDNGNESYREANTIEAGDEPLVFDAPFGRIGVAVCYDLRFPELFRAMLPMDLLVLPAAFTATTGRAHWEILLRARAIENQCFVLASAQGGRHPTGRETFGHSMIIDPWGQVLDCLPQGEGVVLAQLKASQLQRVRTSLPALVHRKV